MRLIAELFSTIENELCNQREWTFDGQGVRSVIGSTDGQQLFITLEDSRRIVLRAEFIDERPKFHLTKEIARHAGHNLHYDDQKHQLWCGSCSDIVGSLEMKDVS